MESNGRAYSSRCWTGRHCVSPSLHQSISSPARKLFQPNNLSRRSPEFTPVYAQTLTNQILSLLGEHYDFPANIVISVFSGANVSSQNFKVETPERKALLKSRDESLAEKMLAEARLTFALSQSGQRVPRIIRSIDGQLVTFGSNRCWV